MSRRILPSRKAKTKHKLQKIPDPVFNSKIKITPPLLVRYKAPLRKKKTNLQPPEAKDANDEKTISSSTSKEHAQKRDKSVAKRPAEPTNLSHVYWKVSYDKVLGEYVTEVSWFGLGSSRFDFSIRTLLDQGNSWELSNQCQLSHVKYKGFSQWYKSTAEKRQQMLDINNVVYDIRDKKYFMVDILPTDDELYVWEGYDNYFVGYGFEFDPYAKITRAGDGKIQPKLYLLYSEEIIVIKDEDLEYFYLKQNAKDDLYQSFNDGIYCRFVKKGKARRLPFYHKVMGKCWDHYIKEQLDNNDIEYEENSNVKKWTMCFEEADKTFPKDVGSHFERLWGKKRHYLDDMDFIFSVKKNKLRIYSVIMNQHTETKHVNGRTIDKRTK
eukprot:148510_1